MIASAPVISNMETVAATLIEELPWSPLDFVRGISASGDRQLYVERLTAPLPETNDVRFLYRLPSGEDIAVFAEKLPWDSDFFGYPIARLNAIFPIDPPCLRPYADYGNAVQHLLSLARLQGVKYLFATVEPRDLATMRGLGQCGFSLIETRAFYHRSLRNFEAADRYPIRTATPADVPALSRTARECVNAFDRFHADPFIPPEDADRMMEKWVEASVLTSFADTTIVPDTAEPEAFCTVKYHREHWDAWNLRLAQPVFSAVAPSMRGWYRKIISEINVHLREVGAEHSYLSTQITNKAVIRVWESLGYSFGKGEHIFRIVL